MLTRSQLTLAGSHAGAHPVPSAGAAADRSTHPRRPPQTRRPEARPAARLAPDIGTIAPLVAAGARVPDRRRVSLRWLTGTVLAGLFGTVLMGGAVYVALDGQYTFARAPQAAALPAEAAPTPSQSNAGLKADRVLIQPDAIMAHQTIRLSTTTRVGDKEVIKVRPFTRVIANLALQPDAAARSIPAFDPIGLFAEANAEPDTQAAGAAADPTPPDDGEVSVRMSDLSALDPALAPKSGEGVVLPIDQVRALVAAQAADQAEAVGPVAAGAAVPATLLPPQLLGLAGAAGPAAGLAYASDQAGKAAVGLAGGPSGPSRPGSAPGVGEPSALDVRVVPENLTEIGKTPVSPTLQPVEQTVLVQGGDSLAAILGRLGATADETDAIAAALGDSSTLSEGQRLRVLLAPAEDEPSRRQPVRVSVYTADTHDASVALSDDDTYVPIEDPDGAIATAQDSGEGGSGMRLYDSVYDTAMREGVPRPIITRLLRIYAYDVDLTKMARPGDTFELFYEPDQESGQSSGQPSGAADAQDGQILYTSLSIDGELKRFYRFETQDGGVDYYDEDGKSSRKFLMRKPISGGIMTSPFGYRQHPILGYAKLHTGVDWADHSGTPILATGNGTVSRAGMMSGYGRHVEVQHANGYVTTYSHMSAFGRGIAAGVRVTMGQVIGYVGTTGLSTGPHVHYEVKINGNFVDPMRIKLPQGRELDGVALRAFEAERERIDGMMNKAPIAEAASGNKVL